jgi:hypothetical protein
VTRFIDELKRRRVGRAMDVLEELTRRPGDFTPSLPRLDPAWNPLRGHTRFRALARG